MTDALHPLADSSMTDATALATQLYDELIVPSGRSLAILQLTRALAHARREGIQQGIKFVSADLQHGLPTVWKDSVKQRCQHLADQQAQEKP